MTDHTRDSFGYGGDFSVFLGMGVGGLVYAVLAWRGVRGRKPKRRTNCCATEGATAEARGPPPERVGWRGGRR